MERWLRYLIVTPDLHRIHHSAWQPETDSNFGAVFPQWDLLLGTFRGEPHVPHEELTLGLAEVRGPEAHQVGRLLLAPLRRGGGVPPGAGTREPAAGRDGREAWT